MGFEEVEFPCPSCGTVNCIAETEVPASGDIRCGRCGETVSVLQGTTPPATSPAKPSTHRQTTDTLIRVEDWESPSGEAERNSGEVSCPQCGHSFIPQGAGSERPTVLVVEDTDFFLHLATDVLGRRFKTIGVKTVAEARQALATSPVQLVVLDLTLPDAEGTEVLKALPRPDIPVLIYTSRDETSLIGPEWQALSSLGASDVIHKGINIEDQLLRKAEDLLSARPIAPA